jgi:hypothetical protein
MNWYSGAVEIYEAEKKALFSKLKMQIKKVLIPLKPKMISMN